MDFYSHMTGAMNFGYTRSDWKYSRIENHTQAEYLQYTHLLTEDPQPHLHSFVPLDRVIEGIHVGKRKSLAGWLQNLLQVLKNPNRWQLAELEQLLPISISKKKLIWILKRIQ